MQRRDNGQPPFIWDYAVLERLVKEQSQRSCKCRVAFRENVWMNSVITRRFLWIKFVTCACVVS